MHQLEKARTPSVSVAAAEDGCGVDAPVATVSPRLDGLFSRRRRVFVSLPPLLQCLQHFRLNDAAAARDVTALVKLMRKEKCI